MPIYEYQCLACEQSFSHFWRSLQVAQESESPPCPHCGAHETQRTVSQVAVLGELGGLTPAEQRGKQAKEDRLSQITPKEQIDQLQAGKKKRA